MVYMIGLSFLKCTVTRLLAILSPSERLHFVNM